MEDRRVFHVSIVFDNPMEASVAVAAKDESHARELIEKQFAERKNLKIIDVFDAVALEKMQREMAAMERGQKLIHADAQDVDLEDPTSIDTIKKVIN